MVSNGHPELFEKLLQLDHLEEVKVVMGDDSHLHTVPIGNGAGWQFFQRTVSAFGPAKVVARSDPVPYVAFLLRRTRQTGLLLVRSQVARLRK